MALRFTNHTRRLLFPRTLSITYHKTTIPRTHEGVSNPERSLSIAPQQARSQTTTSLISHPHNPPPFFFRTPQNTQIYYGYNPKIHHTPPPNFTVRPANPLDAPALTSLWFSTLTHTPSPSTTTTIWWNKTWTLGISLAPHTIQTYVVTHDFTNQIVAFVRWQLPNREGLQNLYLPDFPADWDAGLTEALWGGASRTRAEVMGDKPHWMGEFLAIHTSYKNKGLGTMLLDWGCKQADSAGLEIYGDATVGNREFFSRKFGFEDCAARSFDVPQRVVGIVRKPHVRRIVETNFKTKADLTYI
ncbi:hypothetical protein TWF281_003257 [Arthrobotrys megalospora]